MKHLTLLTRPPRRASIDLNSLFNTKVETKENAINAKATAIQ